MTLTQLLTLSEQHRAAHTQSQHAAPTDSGPGLLAMTRMQ